MGKIQVEVDARRIGGRAAIGGEGAEGIVAALSGKLVCGGHDAAGAGAAAAKGDRADAEARPGVFREGGAAADDERRREAVDGDGLFANCDEAVEVSSVEISAMRGSGHWVRCASFSSTIKKRRSPDETEGVDVGGRDGAPA